MARSSRRIAFVLLSALAVASRASPNPSFPNSDLLVERHEGEHEGHGMVSTASHPSDMHMSDNSTTMASQAEHTHHHADPPKLMLDPSLMITKESYWDYDSSSAGHGGLMSAHIGLMVLAWAIILPIGIMLRAVHHPLFFPLQLIFMAINGLAIFIARMYNALTPDHYTNDSHSRMGYFFIIYASAVLSVDLIRAVRSLAAWFKGDRAPGKLAQALLGRTDGAESSEYEPLDEVDVPPDSEEGQWANGAIRSLHRRDTSESRHSDDTLHENDGNLGYRPGSVSPASAKPDHGLPDVSPARHQPSYRSSMSIWFKYLHIFAVRMLLFLGWAAFLTGIIVYLGYCRFTLINGCLAHYIKGSIFIWYGVITFGRYLGAWSELGWAWNKRPTTGWRSRMPTPEMIECSVIFFYGATNTFMERFGAKPGQPLSIHELEHISIAIMFFGVGVLGIALESAKFRRLISASVSDKGRSPSAAVWSWNFAPALTISLTGLVMSKHHQEYQFAVDVHALWGQLLFLFGVFRMLTYIFLWLRPPTVSVRPSRPPTEALASFCLIIGGVVFILSSEDVVFAAMRGDYADVMLFLNLSTAVVTLFMAWIVALMAIKGWAYNRMRGAIQRVSQPVNLA